MTYSLKNLRALQAAASTSPKLLSGLTPDKVKLVLQSATLKKYRAGRVIIRGGEAANRLFLLKQGRVKYYRVTKQGEEVLLWWLAVGDAFGLGTLLSSPIRYIGTAQAVDDCELLIWSRERIQSLAATHGILAQNALHIILEYLSSYADRLVGLSTGTAEQRLANTLLQLGRRVGKVQPGGVELAIMNEDLAGLADVSPFTASRQLKEWEREGIVRKARAKVFILTPERLLTD